MSDLLSIPFDVVELLQEHAMKWDVTGSRVICDPPVTNTDLDLVVLSDDRARTIREAMAIGFEGGGSAQEILEERLAQRENGGPPIQTDFVSLKRRDVNLLVVESKEFYQLFRLATRVGKKLNLLKREDRVTLFQAILYKNG